MKHDTTKPSHPDECNILKRAPDTETIDRLFLELSQFTGATTVRELRWHDQVRDLQKNLNDHVESWAKLHAIVPDVHGLSLVDTVIHHINDLRRQRDEATLKSSFARGYEQGTKDAEKGSSGSINRAINHPSHLEKVIAELKAERDALKAEYEMRADWIRRMVKILGCENVAGRDCRDPHLVAEAMAEQNAKMYEEIQNLKANNRYQKGHTDGFQCAVDSLQAHLKSFKP